MQALGLEQLHLRELREPASFEEQTEDLLHSVQEI
jgi:hypothetical protein